MRRCCGDCNQGRAECPHPELCEQFDRVPLREVLLALLWPLALVGVLALAGAIYRASGWLW